MCTLDFGGTVNRRIFNKCENLINVRINVQLRQNNDSNRKVAAGELLQDTQICHLSIQSSSNLGSQTLTG